MADPIGALRAEMSANAARFERDMGRAKRAVRTNTRTMNQHFERSEQRANAFRASVSRIAVTMGSAATARAIQRFGQTALRAFDSIGKAADRVGFTTDALQELRFAAGQSGVNVNTLDMALQRFSRRVAEAANGSGELKDTLDQYNIQLRDSEGNMRANSDILRDYADVMKGAESEQEALRMAFKAFDSEGAALVTLFRQGSGAIDEYAAAAHRLGLVIDKDLIDAAQNANDKMTILQKIFLTNLQQGYVRKFAEDIDDLSSSLESTAIGQGLQTIGEGMGFVAKQALRSVGVLGEFANAVEALGEGRMSDAIAAMNRAGELYLQMGTGGFYDPSGSRLQDLKADLDRVNEEIRLLEQMPNFGTEGLANSGAADRLRELRAERAEIQRQLSAMKTLAEGAMGGYDWLNLGGSGRDTSTSSDNASSDSGGGRTGGAAESAAGGLGDTEITDWFAKIDEALNTRRLEAHNERLREAQQIYQDTLTPLERYRLEVERLNELRAKGAFTEEAGGLETYNRALEDARERLLQQNEVYQTLTQAGERAFDRIGSAMTTMFLEGEDAALNWRNMVNSILSEIMQTMMQMAVINPLKQAFGGFMGDLIGGGASGGLSFGAGDTTGSGGAGFSYTSYGGPRARGGPVMGSKAYLVGEEGPEIFNPGQSGSIIPNHALGAGGGGVVNNIVIEDHGGGARTEERRNASGGKDLRIIVGEMVAGELARFGSDANNAMRNEFGLKQRRTRRS